jgi:hypothetical protein
MMIRRLTLTLGLQAGVALATALPCSTPSVAAASQPRQQGHTSAGVVAPSRMPASDRSVTSHRSGYIVASS